MEANADFLIVGSGIAALRAAAELFDAGEVVILTKADPTEGSTGNAQGGIAAAMGPDDSPARHGADTIAAGDGLSDEDAVRVLVEEGPRLVEELMAWGARFDRDAQGRLELAQEGAHSVRRVLHARDATGREIERTLWGAVAAHPRVRVRDHTLATEALVENGVCVGMRYLDSSDRMGTVRAAATLVATGGAGQVFRETTNPHVATGDGVAIAYRATARVGDLEFIQFHPTALALPGSPRFLLSEALRGEGAWLVNEAGERFMPRYESAGDLASRDLVARGIAREAERTGAPIYLTLAHLDPGFVHERFPLIAARCRQAGLDLARDRIPVGPAAHYVMGGVETDLEGRTSVPGLFAAGEAACTRVHGANRLASNSLLEGLVFGARAGAAMTQAARSRPERTPAFDGEPAPRRKSQTGDILTWAPALTETAIRDLMWRSVGLFRDGRALTQAVQTLEAEWQALDAALNRGASLTVAEWRTASLLTVGWLMARAALRRQESRGAHFRTDFPARDDARWRRHVAEVRSGEVFGLNAGP